MGCCVSREDSDFRKECLAAHNKYRANHGSPGLVLSSDLNQIAQKWANRLATTNTLKHSSCIQKSIGENLAYKWSSDNQPCDAAETVKEWYDEIEKYNFKDPKGIAGTGHFTQLVWKATKEVGIAKAKGEDGSHYVVANYRPAGNVIGKHKQNVAPPKKKIH